MRKSKIFALMTVVFAFLFVASCSENKSDDSSSAANDGALSVPTGITVNADATVTVGAAVSISTPQEMNFLSAVVNGALKVDGTTYTYDTTRDMAGRVAVSKDLSGTTVTLTQNIDMAGANFEMIGRLTPDANGRYDGFTGTPFSGVFNGNGKEI